MTTEEILELDELRERCIQRARGRCEWPYCTDVGEQMAHLKHRGMGGSKSVNRLDNVMWMCVYHHDLFDGRRHDGLHREVGNALRSVLDMRLYVGRLLAPGARERVAEATARKKEKEDAEN